MTESHVCERLAQNHYMTRIHALTATPPRHVRHNISHMYRVNMLWVSSSEIVLISYNTVPLYSLAKLGLFHCLTMLSYRLSTSSSRFYADLNGRVFSKLILLWLYVFVA